MSDANQLFDDLFTGASNVVPIKRQQAAAEPAAPNASETASSASSAVQREWYVVQSGVQVGPLILAEVEERWATREINQDTYVWKPGMGEWGAIADNPELLYLITNRPQTAPRVTLAYGQGTPAAASESVGNQTSEDAPRSGAQPIGRLTYAGQAAAAGQQVSWRPAAAKEFAALVESEMVAQTLAQPTPAAPSGQTSSGTQPDATVAATESQAAPGIGDIDLFTPAVSPTLQTMPQFGQSHAFNEAQHARAPHAAFAQEQWTLPAPPHHAGGLGNTIQPIHLVMVVVVAAAISLAAVVVGALMRGGGPPQQMLAMGPAPPVATPAVAPAARASTVAAKATTAPAEVPASVHPAPAPKPYVPKKPKPAAAPSPKPYVPPKPAAPPPAAAADNLADVFESKGDDRQAKLTVNDIVKGVKDGQGKIAQCIKRVQRGRDLPPGRYKLILSWQISNNGAVTRPRVKGPAAVMATSLPSCFAIGMRRWKFPPSKKGAPVRNFPFGPFTIH